VDATTSWGIGLVVKGHWAAWKLVEGWRAADHDIGWVETIAMEVALLWILVAGFRKVNILIHGNNMGVLGMLNKGRSRNAASNLLICQMALAMAPKSILVEPIYVTSERNLADACSHGEFGSADMHLLVLFALPDVLTPFIHDV